MFKTILRPLGAGLILAAAVAPVCAQDPPARIQFGGGGLILGGATEGPRLRQLITRPDVQRGLDLDLKQKNQIAELFKDPSSGRVAVRLEATPGTDPDTLRKSAEEQVRAQFGSLEEKVKKIVKPEQWDRFVEMDLQWRGPLALADAKVAERLKIAPEHRAVIEEAARAYRQEKQEVMMSLAQQNDDGNGRVMVRLNMKELDNPQSPAAKQLRKSKEAAEKKILEALSSEEKARWNKAQGEAFTFRVDIPGNRF